MQRKELAIPQATQQAWIGHSWLALEVSLAPDSLLARASYGGRFVMTTGSPFVLGGHDAGARVAVFLSELD